MDNKQKKEILDKLNKTCQIPVLEKRKQLDILEKQEKEIEKYKSISILNLRGYVFNS